jgi:diguanylate cyclase (GGDEF)-like protein
MIDVDNFKAVNDTHGHAGGDEVLKSISRGCRDRLRHSDVLARFGGEEFVILLCDANAVDAVFLAEILRKFVEERPVKTDNGLISVTASFGIVQIFSEDATIDTALARADKALYMVKRGAGIV